MSRAAALFWVAIALILGAVVWSTQPRTAVQSAARPFLPDFSPAQVAKIDIEWPGGERASLEKSAVDSRWIMALHGSADSFAPWPAEIGRVQGLLRLLTEAREGAEARAMPEAIFLTLSLDSGEPIRLAIDPSALGGTGRIARVGPDGLAQSVASIDEQFVRTLQPGAIESWRSKDLLVWPPAQTTSLDSKQGATSIELVKAGGAWIMRAPLAIKADAGTVEGTLLLLSKTGLDRFLPAAAPSPTDEDTWNAPTRVIRLGARASDPTNRSEFDQTIEVGPAIDAASRVVRVSARDASTGKTLWGPQFAVMNSATLEAIPASPASFISRLVLDLPAADIARFEFRGSDSSGAIARNAGGSFGESDPIVRDLLRLICESPAAQIMIPDKRDSAESGDSIRVAAFGPKDAHLASFTLKAASMPSKVSGAPPVSALEIDDGRVVRSVAWQRPADFLASLRALLTVKGSP